MPLPRIIEPQKGIIKKSRRKDAEREGERKTEKERERQGERVGIILFLLTIVCAAIINVYGPSVRDFGPISIYTLFECQTVPRK